MKKTFDKHLPPSYNAREGGKSSKKRRKFTVHPAFLLLGVYYSFTGELLLFVLATLVALEHELAHSFAAAKYGYQLDRVVLMPYGAVIEGDLGGISAREELWVAVAGPLCNAVTALLFLALWWLYPALYPFTETAFELSLSTAVCNLLPAFPLDGGRVLLCALTKAFGAQKAQRIARGCTVAVAAAFLTTFGCFAATARFDLDLLIFPVFLIFGGVVSFGKAGRYEKLHLSNKNALIKGAEVKRVAIYQGASLYKAAGFCEQGKYLVLEIYNAAEQKVGEMTQGELAEAYAEHEKSAKIADFLTKTAKINQNPLRE